MSAIPPTSPIPNNPPAVQPSQQGQAGIPGSPPDAQWVHTAADVQKAAGIDPANRETNPDGTSTPEKLAEESAPVQLPKTTPSVSPRRKE